MSSIAAAEDVLDDPALVDAADPHGMLRHVAGSGAQVRAALAAAQEADLGRLRGAADRSLVVLGMGGSGMSGDVLAAVAGSESPVPVHVVKGPVLPRWVGRGDLVVAVSCSGTTAETLGAAREAVRRGVDLLAVGAASSPLAQVAADGRGVLVPVPQGRPPRASLWSLAVPVLLGAREAGVVDVTDEQLTRAADLMDDAALSSAPSADTWAAPAQQLALRLRGHLVLSWGTAPVGGVAAGRFTNQVAENAALPTVPGVLPEALHNQVVAADGPCVPASGDIFRDPVEEGASRDLHAVLFRDAESEHGLVARQADAAVAVLEQRGVGVDVVDATGASRVERLASLLIHGDLTSVYLALVEGQEPTAIAAIDELKARTAA